ncbi:glycosyltransferase [Micromonospora sp. NPDC051141]|uniref:glycosyltransferase n=1 Tax=Micromonospora sp. NPDC051141 TaxID=3364284 RepID=UPI00379FD7CD
MHLPLDTPLSSAPKTAVLWGVSFDGTPMSGVVVEFIKLADVFRRRGHRVLLDVGYDIKEDKNRFFDPYTDETRCLPSWIELTRVDGLADVAGYGPAFVRATLHAVRHGEPLPSRTDAVSDAIADRILATWRRHAVTAVLVENGTLPENVAYTRALYRAIERYGRETGLGTYVLWRDHDLMWTSEPATGKYGVPPYPHAVRPVDSPHIRYLALHEQARRRTLDWSPGLRDIRVLHNSFRFGPAEPAPVDGRFRAHHGIPDDAALIARFTRLVPQKRIDRDIDLLARLIRWFADRGVERPVYLFVAGDPTEHPATAAALRAYAEHRQVAHRVVFGGRLAPRDVPPGPDRGHTVADLLAEADLTSFLTSYDYESYGNPIGESIASGVPYLTTRYQMYDAVYGSKGLHAPVLDVTAADEAPITDAFVAEVAELLTNPVLHRRVAAFNHTRGRRYFAANRATELVDELLGAAPAPARRPGPAAPEVYGRAGRAAVPALTAETRMTVVLPVLNEAANLAAVLGSLAGQRGPDGPLDRALFDVLLVDNNSTDDTVARARRLAAAHPGLRVHVIGESAQGVSCARKAGMDLAAERARRRDAADTGLPPFYLVSADADCRVDSYWLSALLTAMDGGKAAIGVCDYHYDPAHFTDRPLLWDAIDRTLRCRAVTFGLFGGFPDGKGFAVERQAYQRVGGIELSYQVKDGRFVNHLSDDWDFGILVRASGDDITYVPRSRVEINPRRVDHAIDEVIAGRAYGAGGIITMRDIRPDADHSPVVDLTEDEAVQAWEFSIKDFVPKNMILPVLLTPALLHERAVIEFFTPTLADRLARRIAEIKAESRLIDFVPIHSYKSPSFRLYFEFAAELFARLRATVGPDIGYPPPLPDCLQEIREEGDPGRFRDFVRHYCEDRESGAAHDYFGNGGVF